MCPCRTLLAVAVFVLILTAPTQSQASAGDVRDHAFEFSGGPRIPFDGDTREAYGTALSLTLGYAGRLNDRGLWLQLETGWVRGSGSEFESDPTFEAEEAVYWLVPIGIGIRKLAGDDPERTLRLFFGAGFEAVFTGLELPFGESFSSSTLGGYFDLRPEWRLGENWNLFLRQRMAFYWPVRYDSSVPEFNHSGGTTSLGLSWSFGPTREGE